MAFSVQVHVHGTYHSMLFELIPARLMVVHTGIRGCSATTVGFIRLGDRATPRKILSFAHECLRLCHDQSIVRP